MSILSAAQIPIQMEFLVWTRQLSAGLGASPVGDIIGSLNQNQ